MRDKHSLMTLAVDDPCAASSCPSRPAIPSSVNRLTGAGHSNNQPGTRSRQSNGCIDGQSDRPRVVIHEAVEHLNVPFTNLTEDDRTPVCLD